MNLEEIRNYCLSKKGTTESFPFDEETLVFKVKSKMFALANINPPLSLNLKSDPEKAIRLREEFDWIHPGRHMNKKHWNTLDLEEQTVKSALVKVMIDDSYNLVVKGLKKSEKEELKKL